MEYNIRNMRQLVYIFVTVVFAVFSSGAQAQDLVILHTNDTHSHIDVVKGGRSNGLGGVERREQYVNSIRKQYPGKVLLVDAGDFSQGSPYFTLFKGDVEVELMDALGYDVTCLGNHEFDNGGAELNRRLRNLKTPVICCNFSIPEDDPLHEVVKPYTIVERGGKKIGFIGMITNIASAVNPKNIAGMKYVYPIPVVNGYARELKQQGCDLVVVLSHSGYDGGYDNAPGDMKIAEELENVDIIIGGHSHTFMDKPSFVKTKAGKEVMVVQDGCWGVEVGKIDIWF